MKSSLETKLPSNLFFKKGSDGHRISRTDKNVALTDVEIQLIYGLCERYETEEFSFDFRMELEAALDHKDTNFE